MRAMFPAGVTLRWNRVLTAFVLAVAIAWAGTRMLRGPWSLVAVVVVAMLVLSAVLATWRGAPLSMLLWGRIARRRVDVTAKGASIDHRLRWTVTSAAIRADGDDVVAVVAVDGPSHAPSVLDHHQVKSAATLPVNVVADALRQFDVKLSGIDIVSVGHRRAPAAHHHHSDTYTTVVGDHSAVGERRTWCVLRLNTFDNAAAVASRDSVAATLAACAQRLTAELVAHRCPARVVDSSELDGVDAALLAGIGSDVISGWGGLSSAIGTIASYGLTPAEISGATLDRLWSPDTDATATTVQLRRAAMGQVRIGAMVRYATAGPQLQRPLTGLNPLSGRHDLGLISGLIRPGLPPVLAPQRTLLDEEDLWAPIGATGIIVGTLPSGHPLLVPLQSAEPAGTSTVTVAGDLALLVQLAQRCAATGMRVAVVTARPGPWRDANNAGLRVVRELPPELPDNGRGMMVVYDHPQATTGPRAAVVVRAVDRGSASVADVHLEQDSNTTAVIRTADFQYRIRIDLRAERSQISASSRRVA
jgi:type VII secretion protein EccE